mmetsp:Transcript_4385/g.12812  ORF Transcript_4385/g.12812 Transcript_4385/m.12812 type:complete len:269 (-) Transcript_4385:387-1193(-)
MQGMPQKGPSSTSAWHGARICRPRAGHAAGAARRYRKLLGLGSRGAVPAGISVDAPVLPRLEAPGRAALAGLDVCLGAQRPAIRALQLARDILDRQALAQLRGHLPAAAPALARVALLVWAQGCGPEASAVDQVLLAPLVAHRHNVSAVLQDADRGPCVQVGADDREPVPGRHPVLQSLEPLQPEPLGARAELREATPVADDLHARVYGEARALREEPAGPRGCRGLGRSLCTGDADLENDALVQVLENGPEGLHAQGMGGAAEPGCH